MDDKVDGGGGPKTEHDKTGHVRKMLVISTLLAIVVLVVIAVVLR